MQCTICHLEKQKRESFNVSASCILAPYELVHCDIWGPYSQAPMQGHHYFLIVVDDYSQVTWIYLIS